MDEAIDAWSEAVRLDPGQHLALYNLTVALAALGREAEAREAGARFLRTAPPSLYAAQLAQIRSLLVGGAGS
jgi:tetratricopeptide (TPR) repeat protein